MKIFNKIILTSLAMAVVISASLFSSQAVAKHKPVTICHKDRMEITVDNSSVVKAHLRHGDRIGKCGVTPPTPIPTP